VLSPGIGRGAWLVWCALIVAALLAGIVGGRFAWTDRGAPLQNEAALARLHTAQQALEQSRLQLRASEARSQELERQIDALNQRLRECLEELTFFRNARDHAKR